MIRLKQFKYPKRLQWLGELVGGIQYELGAISSYMGYINIAFTASTAYVIVAKNYLPITFVQFIIILFIALIAIMIIDWVFIQPGRQAYANKQACEHPNELMDIVKSLPTKVDLEKFKEEFKKEILGAIKKERADEQSPFS